MNGPLDPLSWDEMLDDLGYSDDENDDNYCGNKKGSKGKKKTKFRDYEWDEYD